MRKFDMITVNGTSIAIENAGEYISLTDMVKAFPDKNIDNWLRAKQTIEFIGVWERINNPDFNYVEFDVIKNRVGDNTSRVSVKELIRRTNAIGLRAKAGRHGSGTTAHKDIATHFCMYLSAEFTLLLIKAVDRLREGEGRNSLAWQFRRQLVATNYRIQTDAIKDTLERLPAMEKDKEKFVYINEAELLNKALFNQTSRQWKAQNPELAKQGCIREFASTELLIVMEGLTVLNASMIREGLSRDVRLHKLREAALHNLNSISKSEPLRRIAA